MKKILSVIVSLLLMTTLFSLCVHGENLKDGTYEVEVTLMHKEDEKESFGNKYIAPTALMKVNGEEKIITILLTTNMSGISFSYYLDGSLAGDTAEATAVSNITAAGETYKQGFEIPIKSDNDLGLKFSVPVMPMSPSARLRIDYSSAKLIESNEKSELNNEETTSLSQKNDSEGADTTSQLTTYESTTIAQAQESTSAYVSPTTPTTSAAVPVIDNVTTKQENEKMSLSSAAMTLAFIISACALAILLVYKREDGKVL